MNFMRRWLRFLFAASDKEVNGIIALSLLVLILLIVQILVKNNDSNKDFLLNQDILDSITAEINPVKVSKESYFKKPDHSFDPNRIGARQWISLGLDSALSFRIEKYLAKGGRFKEKKDLLKIYGLPSDFYDSISPYLIIQESPLTVTYESGPVKKNRDHTVSRKSWEKVPDALIDLNASDSITFLKIRGIGPYRASTIIKYRDLLGGYCSLNQLFEVYGLDSVLVESISKSLSLDTLLYPAKKIKINECDFKILVRHPYLNYGQVQAIINFRTQHNTIDLKDFQSFPFLTNHEKNRLIPYLSFGI
jgi:competence protein ComEA